MDTADHLRDASPWRAEPDPIKLAILGKLSEELGEMQAAIGRCIIQGVDGVHPVTGKPNLDWLREEHSDVENLMVFLRRYVIMLRATNIGKDRMENKRKHIQQWLDSFNTPSFEELVAAVAADEAKPQPICTGCNRKPADLEEYVEAAKHEDMTPDDYVRAEEGTYNTENGHFLCSPCYLKAGAPSSRSGWKAP